MCSILFPFILSLLSFVLRPLSFVRGAWPMEVLLFVVEVPLPAQVAGAVLVGMVLLYLVIRVFRRRPAPSAPPVPDLSLDVAALGEEGPPEGGPRLEVYGTPVRLMVVVVAPVGRTGEVPALESLPEVLEQLIPGMAALVASHEPLVRTWPEQLSSRGFVSAFFNMLALPGERGKGTPWCSLAGKFGASGGDYLVGLVGCAAEPNGLSQFAVQHEGQWHDVLRVRK